MINYRCCGWCALLFENRFFVRQFAGGLVLVGDATQRGLPRLDVGVRPHRDSAKIKHKNTVIHKWRHIILDIFIKNVYNLHSSDDKTFKCVQLICIFSCQTLLRQINSFEWKKLSTANLIKCDQIVMVTLTKEYWKSFVIVIIRFLWSNCSVCEMLAL